MMHVHKMFENTDDKIMTLFKSEVLKIDLGEFGGVYLDRIALRYNRSL
jgi:hypothetical protein